MKNFQVNKTMFGYSLFVLGLISLIVGLLTVGCNLGRQEAKNANLYSFSNQEAANSYIAASNGLAAVIDPVSTEKIIKVLREKGLKTEYIILTHGHFDHIVGVSTLKGEFPEARVMINPADSDMLPDPVKNLSQMFGAELSVGEQVSPIKAEDKLSLGKVIIEVIITPGHTPGSVCLKVGNTLFTGDTLFKGSVGRTDFPGSNPQDLALSLKKLLNYPDNTKILPGHGEPTTLGEEKQSNPYLKP